MQHNASMRALQNNNACTSAPYTCVCMHVRLHFLACLAPAGRWPLGAALPARSACMVLLSGAVVGCTARAAGAEGGR